MKKILSLIFSMIIALMLFSGCAETEPSETDIPPKNQVESVSDVDTSNNSTDTLANSDDHIKDYDKEEFFPIGDSESEGFLLKGKKYEYYGNDVLILKVENKTDTAYSIKMRVTFYDESGDKMRSTNRDFEGFAAGWENYFVFRPNITFDSFDYEFESKEYTGKVYSDLIKFNQSDDVDKLEMFQVISWTDPYGQVVKVADDPRNGCVGLASRINFTNSNEDALYIDLDYFVMDNKGELFYLVDRMYKAEPNRVTSKTIVIFASDILWKDKEEFAWPEELTGDVTCIVALEKISVDPLA